MQKRKKKALICFALILAACYMFAACAVNKGKKSEPAEKVFETVEYRGAEYLKVPSNGGEYLALKTLGLDEAQASALAAYFFDKQNYAYSGEGYIAAAEKVLVKTDDKLFVLGDETHDKIAPNGKNGRVIVELSRRDGGWTVESCTKKSESKAVFKTMYDLTKPLRKLDDAELQKAKDQVLENNPFGEKDLSLLDAVYDEKAAEDYLRIFLMEEFEANEEAFSFVSHNAVVFLGINKAHEKDAKYLAALDNYYGGEEKANYVFLIEKDADTGGISTLYLNNSDWVYLD
ncbi:MAG: hypothetical protein IKS90_06000 [Clostridia bacterium]|nr:hypothetical protein [Clostridia bacterium]